MVFSDPAMKVLIINYYWPPCGGPAVQRWLNFTRYLPEHGITPYVLTVDDQGGAFPVRDASLLEQVAPQVRVTRTPAATGIFDFYKKTIGKGQIPSTNLANEPHPNFLQKAARFIRGNFFLPDPRRSWNRYATPAAQRLMEQEDIRCVITAGPPHSTHLIGRALKRKNADIQWLADFHDYWTDSSYVHQFYRMYPARQIDFRYERSVLREADHILTAYQIGCQRLAAKVRWRSPEDFTGLSMGYDEEYFTARPAKGQDHFRITFTGTMTKNFNVQSFFETLARLRVSMPELPLRLCFVGWLSDEVRTLIAAQGLDDLLETPGYVPHLEAIDYLYRSTVLFLITPDFSGEKYHVPGKLYEYLATEKPIFCVAPQVSETAEIVRACRAGHCFERHQRQEMYAVLENWAKQWQQHKQLDGYHTQKKFQRYSRRNETARLADLLHQKIALR